MIIREQLIVQEVQAQLGAGSLLTDAIASVQRIENSAASVDDLAYGPIKNVARIWELHHG